MGSNKHNIKLPFIWMEWGPKAYKEYLKELDQWQKKDEATRGAEPRPRMLDKDVDNFLKLATALKIILGRSVRPQDIPRAKELLLSYLKNHCHHHGRPASTHSHVGGYQADDPLCRRHQASSDQEATGGYQR